MYVMTEGNYDVQVMMMILNHTIPEQNLDCITFYYLFSLVLRCDVRGLFHIRSILARPLFLLLEGASSNPILDWSGHFSR